MKFLTILLLAFLVLAGCAEDRRASFPGEPLIGPFKSMQNYKQVEEIIITNGLQPRDFSHELLARDEKHLSNGLVKIVVTNYSDLGITGKVYLTLFYNRLESVMFEPQPVADYVERLIRTNRLNFSEKPINPISRRALVSSNVVVEIVSPPSGRPFVRWTDIRLEKESSRWIYQNF